MSRPLRHRFRRLHALLALLLCLLPLAAQAVELRDVRLWDGPDATRVVLDLEGGAEHKAFPLARPNRLVIDIVGGTKAAGLNLKALNKGVVKAVRTGPREDGLRVVLDLAETVSASSFGLEPNGEFGYRLVFDLKPERLARGGAPASVGAEAVLPSPPGAAVIPPLPTGPGAAVSSAPIIAAPLPPSGPGIAIPGSPQARPVQVPPPAPPPPPPRPPQGRLVALEVRPPAPAVVPALPELTVVARAQRPVLPKVLATPKPRPKPRPVVPPTPEPEEEDPFLDPFAAGSAPPPPVAATPLPAPRGTPPRAPVGPAKPIVIAIDPGHGGVDPGARGVNGVLEKTVCLAIAKRLAKLLDAAPGYKAVLTRSGDTYLALRERTGVARRAQADLFVSIHANSMPVTGTIRGSAVYVLSERGASSEHAKMLASLENSADLIGGVPLKSQDDDLASVLLDISQTAVREASFDLASRLLGAIGRSYRLQKREPQQAGFAVLKSPDMPSVLVETAFLSDERDARMLASPEHQQAIAQRLFDGVRSYFSAYRPQSQAALGASDLPVEASEGQAQPVNLRRSKQR